MVQPPSPPVADEPMAEEAEAESSTSFQRQVQRQNLRLEQRQTTMHEYNIGAFMALADAFSWFIPNIDPVQLPIQPILPAYPPSDDDGNNDEY